VTRREVQNLVALAYLSEGIKPEGPKPLLRDLGSPNMVHSTSRLIRDLEIVLSPSRRNRLTDNGRQERWYRTAKQEEMYCRVERGWAYDPPSVRSVKRLVQFSRKPLSSAAPPWSYRWTRPGIRWVSRTKPYPSISLFVGYLRHIVFRQRFAKKE
jgi:transposase InsO family protein